MNPSIQPDRLERRLPELLAALAAPRTPDYVDDLLARTAATRQRPRWAFPERWLPMDTVARQRLYVPPLPWRPMLAAALLLAMLATALLLGAAQRRVPTPFGLAGNGQLAYDANGDIYVRDSLSGAEKLVVVGAAHDFAAGFTRDGTHLTFLRTIQPATLSKPERLAVMIADLDGSHALDLTGSLVAPDWGDWSSDDSTFAFQATEGNVPSLFLVPADGSAPPHKLDLGMPIYTPSWRGPDGREIVFRGWKKTPDGLKSGIFAVRPDGTGARPITPTDGDTGDDYQFPQLSPDGRLVVYQMFEDDGTLRLHVTDLDNAQTRLLALAGDRPWEAWATFSPDGRHLLFQSITPSDGGSTVQFIVGTIDGSAPAVKVGPAYTLGPTAADLGAAFSPDGRTVMIGAGADKETRVVDTASGGPGTIVPWSRGGVPSWQRVAR